MRRWRTPGWSEAMGIYQGEDGLIEAFAARFEGQGRDLVFRASLKAPPVRVTEAERDEEISRYRRAMRWMMLGFLFLVIGTILALVAINMAYGFEEAPWQIWPLIGALSVGFLLATVHVRKSPDRRFADRLPAASALQPDEQRRHKFDRISWGSLAVAPLGALAILIPRRDEMLWSFWWNIKLGAVMLLLAAVAVQAYRKWRFEGEDR